MFVKKICIVLLISMFFSCSTSRSILEESSQNYVFDFDSRKTQKTLIDEYRAIANARGFAIAGNILAVASIVTHAANGEDDDHDVSDHFYDFQSVPKRFFEPLIIKNGSNRTLHLNLTTNYMVNDYDNASIRNIILPPQQKMTVIVFPEAKYLAEYRDHKSEASTSSTKLIHTHNTETLYFTNKYDLQELSYTE